MSVIGSSIATIALASVLGDLWNWVEGVFGRIGDLSFYWLVLALGLKTCRVRVHRARVADILRAAYPNSALSFKTAWARRREGPRSTRSRPRKLGRRR